MQVTKLFKKERTPFPFNVPFIETLHFILAPSWQGMEGGRMEKKESKMEEERNTGKKGGRIKNKVS